jgi:hypothetical protein
MAKRMSRRPRVRTIYRNVVQRVRRYRPRKKKINYPLIALGLGLVSAFVYKDKIKAWMNKGKTA